MDMADKNTDINNEDLLNIYDDDTIVEPLVADIDNKKVEESPMKIEEDIFIDTEKTDIIIDIPERKEEIKKVVEPLITEENTPVIEDKWFESEIEEITEESEKKSFFWNLFKKKDKVVDGNEWTDKIEEFDLAWEIWEWDTNWNKKWFFWDLFKKKDKDSINKEENEDNIENNDSNIFDDFNQDDSLIDEIDQIKKERDKDLFYYVDKAWSIMQVLFILSLLGVSITYWYIYIQNKVFIEKKDNQVLEPFCTLLLDNIHYDWSFCTSISTLKSDYEFKLENTKKDQIADILNILQSLYKIENFTKTKDVVFLKDKTSSKLQILKILEEFDNLKTEFDKVDKEKIQCRSITITEKTKTLSMDCVAYSAWYEKWIRWFNWKNDADSLVKWTSVSIANSFLNYITLESKQFTIINRQKIFKSDSVIWVKTGFTNKTSFNLNLKYNIK